MRGATVTFGRLPQPLALIETSRWRSRFCRLRGADSWTERAGNACHEAVSRADAIRRFQTDRFYRGESSRTTPGNGLGLTLVSAVAELHGARLELVAMQPGLRVTLSFPTAERGSSPDLSALSRDVPIIAFVNKLDREGRDPFNLLAPADYLA